MTTVEDIGAPASEAAERRRSGLSMKRGLLAVLTSIIVVFCVVPFLLVFAISFGRKIDGAAWVWDFTFENYQRFFVGVLWPDEVTFLYLQQLGYSFY
ncbi:MAG: hypothetical protein AAGK71_11810, partial [Pseudomonadota bacterium]